MDQCSKHADRIESARERKQDTPKIDNDENKMINDTQFKSIIYLSIINGGRDK